METETLTGKAGRGSQHRLGRRPCGVFKKLNGYANAVPEYNDIPKAVWAAIAISALTHGGDELWTARQRVIDEWATLHANGIVPQKPLSTPNAGTERPRASEDKR